jgi:hypothetical protein
VTADVVNLRRVRKAKARDDKADHAAENRARFGRTLADRQAQAAAEAKAARDLDGHQLAAPVARDDD